MTSRVSTLGFGSSKRTAIVDEALTSTTYQPWLADITVPGG